MKSEEDYHDGKEKKKTVSAEEKEIDDYCREIERQLG